MCDGGDISGMDRGRRRGQCVAACGWAVAEGTSRYPPSVLHLPDSLRAHHFRTSDDPLGAAMIWEENDKYGASDTYFSCDPDLPQIRVLCIASTTEYFPPDFGSGYNHAVGRTTPSQPLINYYLGHCEIGYL